MSSQTDILDADALALRKSAERAQIAADLRDGVKTAEQIAREHKPLADLGKRAIILYELGRSLV